MQTSKWFTTEPILMIYVYQEIQTLSLKNLDF